MTEAVNLIGELIRIPRANSTFGSVSRGDVARLVTDLVGVPKKGRWIVEDGVLRESGATVPDTGTHLVIDGDVQEVKQGDDLVGELEHWNVYTLYVKKPKPTFFEPGKTYELQGSQVRFRCVRVDTDGDGDPVAYGETLGDLVSRSDSYWGTRTRLGNWKEVTS